MQPPLGYTHSGCQVCHIRRALYDLKQAPQAWFEKFSSVVAQQGFTSSLHDTALFVRRSSAGITLILLYVDDMIITALLLLPPSMNLTPIVRPILTLFGSKL